MADCYAEAAESDSAIDHLEAGLKSKAQSVSVEFKGCISCAYTGGFTSFIH